MDRGNRGRGASLAGGMRPDMPRGSSPKRERQHEHTKASAKQRGESTDRGRGNRGPHGEQGPRPVRRGEDGEPHVNAGHFLLPPRWAAVAPGRSGPDLCAALFRGTQPWHQGPFVNEQGAAGVGAAHSAPALARSCRHGADPGDQSTPVTSPMAKGAFDDTVQRCLRGELHRSFRTVPAPGSPRPTLSAGRLRGALGPPSSAGVAHPS
jgi:hypothetical protein